MGSDGCNFSLFIRLWNLLRDDVMIMFDEFHYFASLSHNFDSYFVTLIPKVKNHSYLGDIRSISLFGSLYKLVVKVLAQCLGSVMDKLISPN